MERLDNYKELNDISECNNNDLTNLDKLFGSTERKK